MANLNGFDANEVTPSVGFEPLPAGKYLAAIVDSEMKPTKNGDSTYLQLTFQVLEGEHKGRPLWARLNLSHTKELTVKLARAELSAICRAVGVMSPKDSSDLHDRPMLLTVAHKKRNDTGEITNVIKGYDKKEAHTSASVSNDDGDRAPWQK